MTQRRAPKVTRTDAQRAGRQKQGTEGLMGDGSDLHYLGEDAVFGDAQGPPTFNMGDPRQVARRIAERVPRGAK